MAELDKSREERLAQALRDNLRRRKAQSREMVDTSNLLPAKNRQKEEKS
jgi:hypothetical protein